MAEFTIRLARHLKDGTELCPNGHIQWSLDEEEGFWTENCDCQWHAEADADAMITAANDRWIEANRLEQLGDEIMAERAIEMGYLAACKPGVLGCPGLDDFPDKNS